MSVPSDLLVAVVSSLNEAVVVCDVNGRLVAASARARELLKLSAAVLDGRQGIALDGVRMAPAGVEPVEAPGRLTLSPEAGQELNGCLLQLRPQGPDARLVMINTRLIETEGQPPLLVCTFSPIAAQQRAGGEPDWLRLAFEQSPIGAGFVDATTGQLRQANARYREMAEWSLATDAEGLSAGQPAATGRVLDRDRLPQLAPDCGAAVVEWRVQRRDGSFGWVMVRVIRLVEEGGAEAGLFVVAVDITEPRRKVGFSGADRAKLHATLESMQDAVLICDAEGRFLEQNAAFARLLRFDPQQPAPESFFAALTLFDISLPDGTPAQPEDCAFARALRGECSNGVEYWMRRRDTGEAWCGSFSCGPILDPEQSIVGAVVVGRDVTGARETEQKLRDTSQRLDIALAAASAGWFDWRLREDRLLFSPELADICGLKPGELELDTPTWERLLHPEDRANVVATLQHAFESREPFDLSHRVLRPSGELRWVEVVGKTTYDENGEPDRFAGLCLDVTARRQAEALQAESEARFRAVVENIQEGVLFADRDANVHYRSPSYTQLNGWADEERLFKNGFGLVHPDDVDQVRRAWEQVIGEPGETAESRYRTLHRDGSIRWLETSARNLLDNPDVRSVVMISRDVTGQVAAEQAVRDSEERFRALVEQAADAVFVHDLNGYFRLVNQQACRSTGYSREELLGMQVSQLEIGLSDETMAQMWRDAGPEAQVTVEGCHRRKDGTTFPVELRLGRMELGGAPVVLALARDVTERRRVRESLEQSNLRLEMAISAAQLGIWEWDLETGVVSWDQRVRELYGVADLEFPVSYEAWVGLVHPEDRAGVEERVRACLAGEPTAGLEFRLLQPGGELKYLRSMWVTVRDSAGKPLRFIGLNQDTTPARLAEEARFALEAQLNQARKMESIGRLAGGVAHDFNNLLTVINGYSSLMLARLREGDALYEQVKEISRAGDRAAALTRQLLAFGRRQVLQPRALDLNRVLNGMKTMLGRLVGEDIELHYQLAEARPRVLADPHQIEQVIMNLAVNARDAMPQGGTLTIATGRREFAGPDGPGLGKPPGRYAWFSVVDSGTGMDAATQERIFEPFFTTKGVGEGTGLGLATVLGIVEQSGGSIEVSSVQGEGSRFAIYLPELSGETHEGETAAATPGARGTETILLVEDQTDVRNFTAVALRGFGYQVLTAADAAEAMRISAGEVGEIDLLLTDVIMPQVNGKQLVGRLSRLRPKLKALYMSGYPNDTIVQRGVLEPGAAFIQKPFGPNDLAAKVRAVLDEGAC